MTGDVTEGVGNEDHGTHDDSFGVSDDIGARGSEADTEGSDILSKDVVTKHYESLNVSIYELFDGKRSGRRDLQRAPLLRVLYWMITPTKLGSMYAMRT